MTRWPWRAVAATALALTAFGFVQTATPHPVGVDGLYHIQSATLVRENLPRPWMNEFRWLEYTSLRHDLFAVAALGQIFREKELVLGVGNR